MSKKFENFQGLSAPIIIQPPHGLFGPPDPIFSAGRTMGLTPPSSTSYIGGTLCRLCNRPTGDEFRHVITDHMDQHRYNCKTHLFRTNDESEFTEHRLKSESCDAVDRLLMEPEYMADVQSNRRLCFPIDSEPQEDPMGIASTRASTPEIMEIEHNQNNQSMARNESTIPNVPEFATNEQKKSMETQQNGQRENSGQLPPTDSVANSSNPRVASNPRVGIISELQRKSKAVAMERLAPVLQKKSVQSLTNSKHSSESALGSANLQQMRFQCKACQKWIHHHVLHIHAMAEHETREGVNFYLCPIEGCQFGGRMKQAVRQHLKETHGTEDEVPLRCEDVYGKEFLLEMRSKYFDNIPPRQGKRKRSSKKKKFRSEAAIEAIKKIKAARSHRTPVFPCRLCSKKVEFNRGLGALSHAIKVKYIQIEFPEIFPEIANIKKVIFNSFSFSCTRKIWNSFTAHIVIMARRDRKRSKNMQKKLI